jgi:hypothetical protein
MRRAKDGAQAFGNQIFDLAPPDRGGSLHLPVQFIIDLDRRFYSNKLTGKPAFCQRDLHGMPIPSRGIGVGQWLVRESVAVKGQRAEANRCRA